MCAVQSANFVRSHWIWRHVAYPGGHIPLEDVDSKDSPRDTDSIRAGHAGRPSGDGSPNVGYAAANGRGMHDPTANDAVSRANAA